MMNDILLQYTPWDSKALLIDTYELVMPEIGIGEIENTKNYLSEITDVIKPSLFYCRLNASFTHNIKALHSIGFNHYETQLHIFKHCLDKYVSPVEFGKKRLQIETAKPKDYIEVSDHAKNVFHYSRFHENPFIDKNLANTRMALWAQDMFSQNVPLLVSRNSAGTLDAFLFYRLINDDKIQLILGGCLPEKGFLAPFFWASFLEYFRSEGYKGIETRVSAANTVIVNIYISCGFNLKATYFDFQKHVLL